MEQAAEFIFGTDEFGTHNHTFIGYNPDTETGDNDDEELGLLNDQKLICLIC